MPGKARLVGKAHGHGGQRWLRWRELGMCLISAQPQQKAMERHRLEARLGKLCQRRRMLVVLGRRGKGLKGWWHQRRHWNGCCRYVGRACLQQMRHCQI